MPPNFYYNQQDWITERQAGKGWTWSVLRPQIVCGIAIGSPLNIITAIGVFASISREYGMPLRFPGGAERIGEATDARLIAKAIEWAATSPNAHNQVFNLTNGEDRKSAVKGKRVSVLVNLGGCRITKKK